MTNLLWVRIDADIAGHPKVLALLGDRSPRRWQAFAVFVFAIGWSAQNGTDGLLPTTALSRIHSTKGCADLLVKYDLWHAEPPGWRIHDYLDYQPARRVVEKKSRQALRANCIRWHGPDCWDDYEGCRA
jgi:hypothetical protein